MYKDKVYKIALVDDEALFRKGMAMLINENEKLKSHILASDGRDLLDQLTVDKNDLPDLILCDLEMPIMDGVETTKELAKLYPQIKVVVLSSHYEPTLIMKMVEIGASAFMPKNEKPENFYDTLINVIERGFHYNENIVRLLRDKMLYGQKSTIVSQEALTSREKEILTLICEQKTNKEIGEQIYISQRTVEGHRKNLLEKTNSKNTAGLIIYAVEHGYYDVKIIKGKWSTRD